MTEAVEVVVVAEGAIAATAIVTVLANAGRSAARERRGSARRARGAASMRAVALGGEPPADPPKLSMREQVDLFGDLWPSLGPGQRERLARLADASGLVRQAERWCASRWWWRRLRGARLLALVGRGADTVPRLLDDPHPEVRAQAAAWAADWPLPDVVERLVGMLGDPRTVCRFTVKDSLLRLRRPAVDPLARRLGDLDGVALRDAWPSPRTSPSPCSSARPWRFRATRTATCARSRPP